MNMEEKILNIEPENLKHKGKYVKLMERWNHPFFHKYFLKIYLFFLKILFN